MSEEYNYDDTGVYSSFFVAAVLTLVLVPFTAKFLATRYRARYACTKAGFENASLCTCSLCRAKYNKLRTLEHRASRSSVLIKSIVLCVAWALYITQVYRAVSAVIQTPPEAFNPWTVLGVSMSATRIEIKRAYYSLSKKEHPDRVPESDRVRANEKFAVISRAYVTLTDEEARRRFEEWGDPDGRRTMTAGIALPTWIIDAKHSPAVLLGYGLVFGFLLPWLINRWWQSNRNMTKDLVRYDSTALFFRALTSAYSPADMLLLLCLAFEFRDLRLTGVSEADYLAEKAREESEEKKPLDELVFEPESVEFRCIKALGKFMSPTDVLPVLLRDKSRSIIRAWLYLLTHALRVTEPATFANSGTSSVTAAAASIQVSNSPTTPPPSASPVSPAEQQQQQQHLFDQQKEPTSSKNKKRGSSSTAHVKETKKQGGKSGSPNRSPSSASGPSGASGNLKPAAQVLVLTDEEKLERDKVIVTAHRLLLNAIVPIAIARGWVHQLTFALDLSQMLTQALWLTMSPLLQIAHVSPIISAGLLTHDTTIKTVDDFATKVHSESARSSVLRPLVSRHASVTGEHMPFNSVQADIEASLQGFPKLIIEKLDCGVIGESVISPGTLVTCALRLRIASAGSSDRVWAFDKEKAFKDADTTIAIEANGQHGVFDDAAVMEFEGEGDGSSTSAKKLLRDQVSKSGHAPRFAGDRKPGWWLILLNPTQNALVTYERVSGLTEQAQTVRLRFEAPKKLGVYEMVLLINSDFYMGLDLRVKIKIDVVEAPEVQEIEDDISEPDLETLRGQMALFRTQGIRGAFEATMAEGNRGRRKRRKQRSKGTESKKAASAAATAAAASATGKAKKTKKGKSAQAKQRRHSASSSESDSDSDSSLDDTSSDSSSDSDSDSDSGSEDAFERSDSSSDSS